MFTPGARTHWHTHKTRQILVATQGTGMVQVRGKPAQVLRAGDVADNTTWLEAVEEGEYRGVAVAG